VAAFAVGSGRVFVDAAAFGAVATIVGAERFVEGQAAVSAAWSIGFFAGPALAGGLVSAIGPGRALAAEAGALAFAALLVSAIRTSLARGERPSHAGAVQEGIRFIARNRAIATYTGVIIVWNVVGGGALALEVPLLRDSVGLSSGQVGFILATGSLAALAGSVFAAGLSRRFGARAVLRAGFLAIPIAVATLGAAAGFAVALIGTVGYLMGEGVTTVLSISERQRRTPDRLQGRVGIAGRMVALGAVAVGSALASALTRAVPVGHVYLLMGAAMLVVGVAATPLLLRLDD
jgi:Transmembrane secretion effector